MSNTRFVVKRIFWLRLAIVLLAALPAAAQGPTPLSSEFQVNFFTVEPQLNAAVSTNSDGGFVVVWQSYNQDGHDAGIFSQRFDSNGFIIANEFQVNTFTMSTQGQPAVANDGNGDLVIVWESWGGQDGGDAGVFAQRLNSDGGQSGSEFRVNTYTLSNQKNPAVARRPGGDFMVVWESFYQVGASFDIFAQFYASDGSPVANEFQVNTFTSSIQSRPAVTTDGNGDFVVIWQSQDQDGADMGVFAQKYASNGGPLATEFQVNTFTDGDARYPTVTPGRLGGFTAVWQDTLRDGDNTGVFAQQFASDGSRIGSELQINTYTTAAQQYPVVANDGNDGFVVVWQSTGQDGDQLGIFGQHIASSGTAIGMEFQVNTFTTSHQGIPAISSGSEGTFVVAWDGATRYFSYGYEVVGQRYTTGLIFVDGFESQDTGQWSSKVGRDD